MQVLVAALVVVQVNVAQAVAVGGQDLAGGVLRNREVGVTEIQMQPQFGHSVEDFAHLRGIVELAGQVFDHQADAVLPRFRQQLAQGLDVAPNVKRAVVKRREAVGMNVHPHGAEFGKNADAAAEFSQSRLPELLDGARQRQVIRRVSDDRQLVPLEFAAHLVNVDVGGGGPRRFERKVEEFQPQGGHPSNLLDDVAARVIHRSDQHFS